MIATAGAGRMGRSIAIALALAGHRVTVLDLKDRPAGDADRLCNDARDEIATSLQFLAELNVVDAEQQAATIERITIEGRSARADDVLQTARVVFEAATETLAAKESTFARLSAVCALDAIVASTSSTLSANELAPFVTNPQRFIITHWLNPAYLIPVVEVSPGERTSEATTSEIRALLKGAGKIPVVCKPSPGFIVPRIQALAMNEAARIVAEGVATAEDVDTAIRYGFGFRYAVMGLLEFIDLGGVDILFHASRHLSNALGDDRFAAPDIINDLIGAGDLGQKTGRGFYDWSADGGRRRDDILRRVVGLLRHLDLLPEARK